MVGLAVHKNAPKKKISVANSLACLPIKGASVFMEQPGRIPWGAVDPFNSPRTAEGEDSHVCPRAGLPIEYGHGTKVRL